MNNLNNSRCEASLHTVMNGQELEMRLPTKEPEGGYTPMMKFLAAVLMRAEDEFGWWEDQVAWYEKRVAELKVEIRRKQIRLVKAEDGEVSQIPQASDALLASRSADYTKSLEAKLRKTMDERIAWEKACRHVTAASANTSQMLLGRINELENSLNAALREL